MEKLFVGEDDEEANDGDDDKDDQLDGFQVDKTFHDMLSFSLYDKIVLSILYMVDIALRYPYLMKMAGWT